jgi:hypothetical protein
MRRVGAWKDSMSVIWFILAFEFCIIAAFAEAGCKGQTC